MPTEAQVLEAFDALDGNVHHPMALVKKLESAGFGASEVATANNAALELGVLVKTETGSIRKG
jgi:hypothetical protein